ncbi:HNH endonuclease [Puteibacter caeruleilacunae]|nr:HNH endonuclease [Puteibacter caeruleilacunae]
MSERTTVKRRNWSDDELIIAFNLYCKIPFGKIHHRNPDIITLATLINRSPNAVALKLSNFASFDPELKARGIKGLKNASKADKEIFERFYEDRETLAFQSETCIAQQQEVSIEDKFSTILPELNNMVGEERQRYVKTRVNQNFFRKMILANYDSKCAISGIDVSQLLVASHIIPWSKSQEHRLNPENGICLSTHFDTAFDKYLISFDEDYRLILSPQLKENETKEYYNQWFVQFEGKQLSTPNKYLPGQEFLKCHRAELIQA